MRRFFPKKRDFNGEKNVRGKIEFKIKLMGAKRRVNLKKKVEIKNIGVLSRSYTFLLQLAGQFIQQCQKSCRKDSVTK